MSVAEVLADDLTISLHTLHEIWNLPICWRNVNVFYINFAECSSGCNKNGG